MNRQLGFTGGLNTGHPLTDEEKKADLRIVDEEKVKTELFLEFLIERIPEDLRNPTNIAQKIYRTDWSVLEKNPSDFNTKVVDPDFPGKEIFVTERHAARTLIIGMILMALSADMPMSDTLYEMIDDVPVLEYLFCGLYFHDLGKPVCRNVALAVSSKRIYNRTSEIDATPMAYSRAHAALGEYVGEYLNFHPYLRMLIRGHHERVNGLGYPDGLSENNLSIPLQYLSLADTIATMLDTSKPQNGDKSLRDIEDNINRAVLNVEVSTQFEALLRRFYAMALSGIGEDEHFENATLLKDKIMMAIKEFALKNDLVQILLKQSSFANVDCLSIYLSGN